MLTTPLEIVNLNGTLRRGCSIFYNDHPLTNEENDDKKLLEEIYLLSTSPIPGSQRLKCTSGEHCQLAPDSYRSYGKRNTTCQLRRNDAKLTNR